MNKTQAQRLLNVASALRESPNKKGFTMEEFHDCGSPCCALGHYAARSDLQTLFSLVDNNCMENKKTLAYISNYSWNGVPKHFGLTKGETDELFNTDGCGDAQTPIQAARYIEKFLDDRDWTVAS